METTLGIYGQSLSLLTDLYQVSMAYGYWKTGIAHRESVFELFFRKNPFKGGYAVACGLAYAVEYLRRFRFDPTDIEYLATLRGNDGAPLFEPGFLAYLSSFELQCDIDAVPEGTVVFPHEPLMRVQGPIIACQLLETPLLNLINFQTLIATKAARVCEATQGETVLEFGLRRAQGIDGALAASRAAYLGGCAATSNVLAGKLFGIPVRGTHAHSWVMAFDDEEESFRAYSHAMPNNCVFLVDTYDTLEGVRKAARVGLELRAAGHKLAGIRLDSGDLAYLSIESRKILDEAGLTDCAILASNDLDEEIIASLKQQGAKITVWGVGTKLATAYDQPALGGVYKLTAVRDPGQPWQYRVKLSEQAVKVSTPGIHQVRRYVRNGEFVSDMVYDTELGVAEHPVMIDPMDPTRRKGFHGDETYEELLVPVMRAGKIVYTVPSAEQSRARCREQVGRLHPGVRRFVNPHQYPVGLESRLHELRTKLVLEARGV